MIKYRWRCLACGETNAPELARCHACDCPATASVGVIDRYASQKLTASLSTRLCRGCGFNLEVAIRVGTTKCPVCERAIFDVAA